MAPPLLGSSSWTTKFCKIRYLAGGSQLPPAIFVEKCMWEYAICERTWNNLMDESSMNNFGKDGWELVQVIKAGPREAERQYIFKRLKK